jgi:integrase
MDKGVHRPSRRPRSRRAVGARRTELTSFHRFASEWVETWRHEWSERTVEDYEWALSNHLLPFFSRHKLTQITPAEIDRYRSAKVREAKLSPNSVNKTLTRLSQVLEVAVEQRQTKGS